MSGPRKQTRRKPTDVRRREIAEAVLRLIGERGARALTTATIAGAVEVTPGALFRHFETLDDITSAAVERAIEQVEGTFPPADLPPLERLERVVLARIAAIRQMPALAWLLLSDQVYLSIPPPAVERLRALVERSKTFLLAALREGQAQGSLRSDVAPEHMLILFTGVVHGLSRSSGVHAPSPGTVPGTPRPADVVGTLFELLRTPAGNETP
jgi:AcrR family transcriptional regulator